MVETQNVILVLQSGRWLRLPFNFSVLSTSFQVEYLSQILCVVKLHGVLHQHYVYLLHRHRVHRENSEYLCQQRILMFDEMLAKGRQLLQVKLQLLVCHCLYYPLAIVGEEEKRATTPCSFPCFEHHVTVELGTERTVEV